MLRGEAALLRAWAGCGGTKNSSARSETSRGCGGSAVLGSRRRAEAGTSRARRWRLLRRLCCQARRRRQNPNLAKPRRRRPLAGNVPLLHTTGALAVCQPRCAGCQACRRQRSRGRPHCGKSRNNHPSAATTTTNQLTPTTIDTLPLLSQEVCRAEKLPIPSPLSPEEETKLVAYFAWVAGCRRPLSTLSSAHLSCCHSLTLFSALRSTLSLSARIGARSRRSANASRPTCLPGKRRPRSRCPFASLPRTASSCAHSRHALPACVPWLLRTQRHGYRHSLPAALLSWELGHGAPPAQHHALVHVPGLQGRGGQRAARGLVLRPPQSCPVCSHCSSPTAFQPLRGFVAVSLAPQGMRLPFGN